MRTCLFCPNTRLTLEHVWPNWISRLLYGQPKQGRFTASRFEGDKRTLVGAPYKASELNHTARIVCGDCNNGWMSEVEEHAKGVLQPLLIGRDNLTLDDRDQATLRAWVVLRAMILKRAASHRLARPFYTDDERQLFADIDFEGSLDPIDGAYIWVFQYRSPQWAARSHVLNGGLHVSPGGTQAHPFQVITGFIAGFGFQILIARWPERRRLEMRSPAVGMFAEPTALLWPHSSDGIDWPPGDFYLADNSYEPLLNRFIDPGFPLQKSRG